MTDWIYTHETGSHEHGHRFCIFSEQARLNDHGSVIVDASNKLAAVANGYADYMVNRTHCTTILTPM